MAFDPDKFIKNYDTPKKEKKDEFDPDSFIEKTKPPPTVGQQMGKDFMQGLRESFSDALPSVPSKDTLETAFGIKPEDKTVNWTAVPLGVLRTTLNVLDVPAGATRTGALTKEGTENLKKAFGTKEAALRTAGEGLPTSQDFFEMPDEEAKQKLSALGLQLREFYKQFDNPWAKLAAGVGTDILLSPELWVGGIAGGATAVGKALTKRGFKGAGKFAAAAGRVGKTASKFVDPLGTVVGAGAEKLAKKTYTTGFADIDRALTKEVIGNIKNGKPLSEVMWKYGAFFNSLEDLRKVIDAVDLNYREQLSWISAAGAPVDEEQISRKIYENVFGDYSKTMSPQKKVIYPDDPEFSMKDAIHPDDVAAYKNFKAENKIFETKKNYETAIKKAQDEMSRYVSEVQTYKKDLAKYQADVVKYQTDIASYNKKMRGYGVGNAQPPTPPVKPKPPAPPNVKLPPTYSPQISAAENVGKWEFVKDRASDKMYKIGGSADEGRKQALARESVTARREALDKSAGPRAAAALREVGKDFQTAVQAQKNILKQGKEVVERPLLREVSTNPTLSLLRLAGRGAKAASESAAKKLVPASMAFKKTRGFVTPIVGFPAQSVVDPLLGRMALEGVNAADRLTLDELQPRGKTFIENLTGISPNQDQYSTPASEQEFKQDVSQQVKEVLDAHGIPVTDEYALALVGGMVAKKASPAEISEKLNDEYEITDTGVVTGTEDIKDTRKPKEALKYFMGESKKREPQSEGPFGKLKRTRKPNYILMTPEERKLRR